ncbi:hypothetical protein PGB28_06465 [Primorskyibacter aestuariivivens]|uniref:DUF6782 family putative metallopeptidase n=1 Tax=Primorskyibacter aestuariivivens TaxID=1888912 RepID=UPI0023007878|nr:DUF6782 family putative metallopeptidase [Primorskyibacter aestuariivivens]MDA7428093.1 hypothetical protein [Primorskyibacter aestuariivivens]
MGLPDLNLGALACALSVVFAAPAMGETGMDCAAAPFSEPKDLKELITALEPVFRGFPTLNAGLTSDISEICLLHGPSEAQGYFEPDTRRIVLRAGQPVGLAQAILVHELRHAAQYATGICPGTDLAMADYAEAIFAMEADASVAGLVVADFMRNTGHDEMWQALAGWPMQADIAIAYDTALRDTGDIAQAASTAFDAWYEDPIRRQTYYVSACLDYLDQLERDHLLPRYESLGPSFYSSLCRLPDGTSYDCNRPETGD